MSIDEIVSDEHHLRFIDKYIDFSFLLEKVRPYYSDDNGRPTDPLIFLKMMFIGYLFGIRSERQLEREIRTNVAYRWFLGLIFKDPVLHHSTINDSQNLRVTEKWESKSGNDAQNTKRQEKWESKSRNGAQNTKRQEKWESKSRNGAQNQRVAEKRESKSRYDAQNPKRRPNEWRVRTALVIPRKVMHKSEVPR
ncbi:ISBma2-like transposase [Bacillus sp. 1NLA3E]|nr:ISBma2-like transposase [Bacillus sp. 1NLA3E]